MTVGKLVVEPLSEVLGAEIKGVEPAHPQGQEEAARLRESLDAYGLLLFRGSSFGPEDQIRLVQVFAPAIDESGEGSSYAFFSNEADTMVPGFKFVFHSDYVFTECPAAILSLYAVDVDEGSVPTNYVSCARAARTLPTDLLERVKDMKAVHATDRTNGAAERLERTGGMRIRLLDLPPDQPDSLYPRTSHPVIKVHPRTSEPLLFVNEYFTSHLEGLGSEASESLLAELFEHLYDPSNMYTHRWEPGDLIIWDNLALQHARDNTFTGSPRRLRRVIGSEKSLKEMMV